MYQLLYTSEAVKPFNEAELAALLEVARLNNSSKLITGMLLYCNSNFIQLLEGEQFELMQLFDIIAADSRHHNIQTIISGKILQPQFPDWSMGYRSLTAKQLTNLDRHEDIDVSGFIRNTKPFKLLKLLSVKSWN